MGRPVNKRASEIPVVPGWDLISPVGAHPEAVVDSGETNEVWGFTSRHSHTSIPTKFLQVK